MILVRFSYYNKNIKINIIWINFYFLYMNILYYMVHFRFWIIFYDFNEPTILHVSVMYVKFIWADNAIADTFPFFVKVCIL